MLARSAVMIGAIAGHSSPPIGSHRSPPIVAIDVPNISTEWSLQSVGVFDGVFLAACVAGLYFVSARDGDDADDAADAVAAAEERVRASVENSPCNGPSIDALEELEAADAAAAAAVPTTDPNELPSFGSLMPRLRRRKGE